MTKNDVVNALAKQLVIATNMNSPHDGTATGVIVSLANELGVTEEVDLAFENYESRDIE